MRPSYEVRVIAPVGDNTRKKTAYLNTGSGKSRLIIKEDGINGLKVKNIFFFNMDYRYLHEKAKLMISTWLPILPENADVSSMAIVNGRYWINGSATINYVDKKRRQTSVITGISIM